MKNFVALFVLVALSFVFAVPAPQQIIVELGKPFSLQGLDSATFEEMRFDLGSVTVSGDTAQVMVNMTIGEESEPLMLESPLAASVEIGEYILTLLGAEVPEDSSMSCAVSTARLVLEKTETAL
jgi:hypothetical protein